MKSTPLDLHATELIETHLEVRDGAVWLVGLCPGCWELVAVRARALDESRRVTCANGHTLRVKELRSEGSYRYVSP